MTGRERILKTLNHEEPDRIPIDLGGADVCRISFKAYKRLLNYLGIENDNIKLGNLVAQTAKLDNRFYNLYEIDVRPIELSNSSEWELEIIEEEDHYWFIDEWQRKWKKPKNRGLYYDIVTFPLANQSLSDYKWPNPRDTSRFRKIPEQFEKYGENEFAMVVPRGLGNGFLQMGAQLYGYERWFTMLAEVPEEVEKFLNKYYYFKKSFWEELLNRFGDNIDVVCELDDLGMQTAPWISKEMYRRLIKPRQKKLFSFIKEYNVSLLFHSDGAIFDFIPDLIETGIDILNPIQVSASGMDTALLKKEFGKDLVFWGGGVDTQRVLPYGTPEEVKAEVKSRINDLAAGGGYVFSTVHNIQSDVPPENIVAMLEAYQEMAEY